MGIKFGISNGKLSSFKYINTAEPVATINHDCDNRKRKIASITTKLEDTGNLIYLSGVVYLKFTLPSPNSVAIQIKRNGKELYQEIPIDERPQISGEYLTVSFPFEIVDKPEPMSILNDVVYEVYLVGIQVNGSIDVVGTRTIVLQEIFSE